MTSRSPILIVLRLAVGLAALLGSAPFEAAAHVDQEAETAPPIGSALERWNDAFPQVQPTDRYVVALVHDAADGTLDDTSLLRAGLIASQVTDRATIDDYASVLERWCDQLHRSGKVTGSTRCQAAVVLEAMHDDLLDGEYDKYATELTSIFERGDYNCVSATLLFCHLAQRFDLDVDAVARPGHAWCIIRDDATMTDVETTCATWFRVIDNRTARESLLRNTTGLSPGVAHVRRSITPVQLIATIYYNRGVQQLEKGNYATALRANVIAATLDGNNATIYSNLLATVNNWALALSQQGQYDKAIDLLARGLAVEPSHASFTQNDLHIHQAWVQSLWKVRRGPKAEESLERALQVLDRAQKRHPNRADLTRARQRLLSYTAREHRRSTETP